MMQLSWKATGIALAAAAAFGAAHPALANNTIASTVDTTGSSVGFDFDGSQFTFSAPLPVQATSVFGNTVSGYLYFTPLSETAGSASTDPFGTGALFGGGTFDLSSTTAVTGDLLSGTFNGSVLASSNGSSGEITTAGLDGVQYTGGSFLTDFNSIYGGSGATGDLTLDLSAINPLVSATDGNLNAFTAQGSSTTFDAVPSVPEANPAALVGFSTIGLLGLAVRARRTQKSGA